MINLHWIILLPIIFGTVVKLIPLKAAKKLMILFQAVLLVLVFVIFIEVRKNGTILENIGGWPDTISITLRADLLASTMALLTCLLFFAMVTFVQKKQYADHLFFFLFLSLESLIIGIFISNDLFNIFVLIEAATLIITILIMYKKTNLSIYDGMMYFLINVVAMSFFLMGLGMLYKKIGVLDFYALETALSQVKDPDSMILPYAFMITAVSLKAALMPLFSWLPKAHGTPSAPSEVSAILSGLYVKTGVYLFIRLQLAFSPLIDTSELFMVLGFITAIVGFVLAFAQTDIKLLLAYSTVSQIGLIMVGINMGSPQAYWGGLYHIMNHAVFKSTLFLTAGMIITEYKTRNLDEIKGVFNHMPAVGMATVISILGIVGAPLFNGSISKYLISEGSSGSWIEYGLIFINLGTIIVFIKYGQLLFGESGKKETANSDILEKAVVLGLSMLCFFGGIFGSELISILFEVNFPVEILSHGVKLLLFVGSLFLGLVIYYGLFKKKNYLAVLNAIELGFNEICLSITLFFAFMVIYLKITL
ncbi:complex I subunit 5 family protein [Acetobacterium sp. K1/6]|jgi:Formate hydrogenlyase subunit 3/Multisubunit Na+/H+ antiporter, MnhD subunit|uniref:complex I subunit 5 family protein n=1 Tax=Acetobacterium sp. K1/6 TaxID=3055467 RepID=UPI002ACA9B01|nr:proton-conducting transporter membrane subunit [Acetobacterium sp. K1/6]MDZ5726308.1 proton-conducting transporter membrane subunit [Acetobacterium sp. K1/6]